MISRIVHSKDFAGDAARFILDHARKAIAARGLFRLGLTGGRSPQAINAALIAQAGHLPWNKIQLTFGDERCVPPDHDDSNYRVARESLLDPSRIPEGNVFRMRGEIDPEEAAREYEAKLRAVATRFGEPRYVHDLLLLGLGEDGHTASLFPRLTGARRDHSRSPARHRPKATTATPQHDLPAHQCGAAHPVSRAATGKARDRRGGHCGRQALSRIARPRPGANDSSMLGSLDSDDDCVDR